MPPPAPCKAHADSQPGAAQAGAPAPPALDAVGTAALAAAPAGPVQGLGMLPTLALQLAPAHAPGMAGFLNPANPALTLAAQAAASVEAPAAPPSQGGPVQLPSQLELSLSQLSQAGLSQYLLSQPTGGSQPLGAAHASAFAQVPRRRPGQSCLLQLVWCVKGCGLPGHAAPARPVQGPGGRRATGGQLTATAGAVPCQSVVAALQVGPKALSAPGAVMGDPPVADPADAAANGVNGRAAGAGAAAAEQQRWVQVDLFRPGHMQRTEANTHARVQSVLALLLCTGESLGRVQVAHQSRSAHQALLGYQGGGTAAQSLLTKQSCSQA